MIQVEKDQVNGFVSEIEALLRLHNVPAALNKCAEMKGFVRQLGVALL